MAVTAIIGAVQQGASSTLGGPLGNAAGYTGFSLFPNNIPDQGTLIRMFHTGFIDVPQFVAKMQLHGTLLTANVYTVSSLTREIPQTGLISTTRPASPGTANEYAVAMQQSVPDAGTLAVMYNRKIIDVFAYDKLLEAQGFRENHMRRAIMSLAKEIPGPSDLVSFAVREAFTPTEVELLGYHKELPKAIIPWMEAQGMGGQVGFARPAGATDSAGQPFPGQATWFDLYWWAHWELPGVSQVYEMFHRQYATSRFGPSPNLANGPAFTQVQMENALKVADYPEYWRKLLIAISYSRISIRQAANLFQNDQLTDREVYHIYRQGGYDDASSVKFMNAAIKVKQERFMKVNNLDTKQELCKMFSLGIIAEDDFRTRLSIFIKESATVDEFVRLCQLRHKVSLVEHQIKTIKEAFTRGLLDQDDLHRLLNGLGLQSNRVDEMIKEWNLDKTLLLRPLSTSEQITYYKDGIIDLQTFASNLYRLQYSAVDVNRIILHANQAIAVNRNKVLEKVAKASQKQIVDSAKSAQKSAKQLLSEQEKAARKVMAASTDKNLIAWYQGKLLTRNQIINRLVDFRGWTKTDAQNWATVNLVPKKASASDAATKKTAESSSSTAIPTP